MKPHIWYRHGSRAFCLSCDAEKRETLVGQSCAGPADNAAELEACPTCWRLMDATGCRACGLPVRLPPDEIAAAER
jgi:hypothetical protein